MKRECGESSKVVALDKRDLYLVVFISRPSNVRADYPQGQGNTRNNDSIFRIALLAYPPCVASVTVIDADQ